MKCVAPENCRKSKRMKKKEVRGGRSANKTDDIKRKLLPRNMEGREGLGDQKNIRTG